MIHCINIEFIHYKFKKEYYISFTEDRFALANSAGPNAMPHYVAFQLGLHCLPKKPFRVFWPTESFIKKNGHYVDIV